MGIHASSAKRLSASSAIAGSIVVIPSPDGSGPILSGGGITSSTTVKTQTVSVGSSTTSSSIASGPTITSIQYLDANNNVVVGETAVSTAGGTILVNGTNFVANGSVYVNNTLAANTVLSSTQMRVTLPATASSNVSLMIFTPTNVGTVGPSIRFSGVPSWTTSAVSFQNGSSANTALVASSDSTLTYTLQGGSTLPTGISLVSSGYLSGTPTGYVTNSSGTFVLIATDLEGQATQQTVNWTVGVSDAQFNYTTLLLNGETSVTPFINDASTNSSALAIVGDTKADKFSPYYGDGYYSVNLSTSGSDLGFSRPALGNIFTIEMWVYPLAAGNNTNYFVGGPTTGPIIGYNGTTFSAAHQGGWSVAASTNPTVGAWNHIALVREGTGSNQFKLYLNGLLVGTGTDATTFGAESATIGASSAAQSCYISNFRIVNNQALYTGNFTPSTTPLTASTVGASGANVAASISGTTVIMAAQSANFVDKSASPLALTTAGVPKVSPSIPFAASSTYATYGSAYFDGTGDYITSPATANTTFGTGDFTVECWAYLTAATQSAAIVGAWSGSNSSSGWLLSQGYANTSAIRFGMSDGSTATFVESPAGALTINQWLHIAAVRSSGTLKLYVNGVQQYSGTLATNNSVNAVLGIAAVTNNTYLTTGYISDVRIVKGAVVYATAFTPPTSPLTAVANTQLLTLQYNGGGNNNGIIDNGPFTYSLTRGGSATQGTFSPFSATGWSNYFNGTTDYLSIANNTAFDFSTGDFTVEAWVYMTAYNGGNYQPIFANAFLFYIGSAGQMLIYNGSSDVLTGTSGDVPIGLWAHVAWSRTSGTTKAFVNGVQKASTAGANAAMGSGSPNKIGNYSTIYFPGYISNLRVIKGQGLYTGTFTPSTTTLTTSSVGTSGANVAASITGTVSLLACQSNRAKDNSTNAFSVTIGGTSSTQAFSPFAPGAAYSPSTNGGSGYFNGSTDYVSVPSGPFVFSTGNFTIEAWVYTPAYGGSGEVIIDNWAGSPSGSYVTNQWQLWITSAGVLKFDYATGASTTVSTGTGTVPLNQWNHVAAVRNGTTLTVYLNGVASGTATVSQSLGVAAVGSIGQQTAGTHYYFNGYISDARAVVGTAVYTTNFTPPTAPLTAVANTQVLCSFTNGGIVDAHASVDVITIGGTQISTAVKKYGSGSISFLGSSSQYLSIPYSPNFAFGSGDFTVEAWVNPTSTSGTQTIISMNSTGSGSSTQYILDFGTTATGRVYSGATAYTATGPAASITANQWNHIAFVRYGNNITVYVNGTGGTPVSVTGVTTNNNTSMLTFVGAVYTTGTTVGNYLTGNLDDVRITKGFARYTANFTSPTSPFLTQ